MSGPQPPQQRELVFCHACENEWYRDEHGLVCPGCHGEFTEIIEQDHDPRAPDPDEDDIDFLNQPNSGRNQPGDFPPNIFSAVGSIFGAALGGPGGIQQQQQQQHNPAMSGVQDSQRSSSQSPGRQTSGSPLGPTVHVSYNSGPGYTWTSRTSTTYVGGGGGSGGLGQGNFYGSQSPEFGRMLIDILGTIQGARGPFGMPPGQDGFPRGFGPGGMGGGPFGDLFSHMMGMHGNPGDYVTNQEAFDRMMSQLMDEHASGSAPGPASADAIASLQRTPADHETLGGDKADCSICMDEVALGQDIIKLPCSHWYHPDCIVLWLKEHDTCAICRKGIMPQSGDASTARQPAEAPLNDHDPAELARRQSGTREDPIWVPESPSQARRTRPGNSSRSTSGAGARPNSEAPSSQGHEGSSFTRSLRNMFSGSGTTPNDGRGGAPRR